MIIIFLDIDGVLLPFGHQDEKKGRIFPSCTLGALSYVLEELPDAQLVLSSTWRVQQSFIDMIVKDFRTYGGSVLKNTEFYDTTNPQLHSERQHEIYEWLRQNHSRSNIRAWIALDDEELLEGEMNATHRNLFERHVVKTDSHVGMTMEDALRAVTLLRNQLHRK